MQEYRAITRRGAVAACALALALGGYFTFFGQNEVKNCSSVSCGGVKDIRIGQTAADANYTKKVVAQNVKEAQQAQDVGASFVPKPVGPTSKTVLQVPTTPNAPTGDSLAEWRAKTEAKRVQMEREQAPEEKQAAWNAAPNVFVQQPAQSPLAPPPVLSGKAPASILPPYQGQPWIQDQGRDAFPAFADSGVKEAATDPVSTFSVDVDTGSYSFLRRMIQGGHLPPADAVRTEELINYFPYDYPTPREGAAPFEPTIAVYDCPWKPTDKLVHIGLKAAIPTERVHSNIVFLIDTSGSMNAPDRLPLVVSSFKLLLDSLAPDDTVGIVTYAGYAGVALQPTKVADRAKIEQVLNGLYAEGSTAGYDGLNTAYGLAAQNLIKQGNNRIILATDGDFNVGISDPAQLEDFVAHKRDSGIALSVLGVGQDNYQETTMKALAKSGNGAAAYIDNLNEARKVLQEEAGATLTTVAKDVKIQVEFNPATVQEYRLIGWETRPLAQEDFNNDRVGAGQVGAGHAVTAIYEVTPEGAPGIIDELRYGTKATPKREDRAEDKATFSNELAFLKIRYKQPEADASQLLQRPISVADEKSFAEEPDDIRFAAAVAGFGQMLRKDKFINTLSWDQLIDMASTARGKDEPGYRAEFVNLLRLARAEAGVGTALAAAPVAEK